MKASLEATSNVWGSLRPLVASPSTPFLKWAGGKSRHLSDPLVQRVLKPLFQLDKGRTYYEPFLGGGAFFLMTVPRRAILSDLNGALILTYKAVRSDPDGVVRALQSLSEPTRERYYQVRRLYNQLISSASGRARTDPTMVASLFIWLNHTCYNGLYRVNRRGEFNVPFGNQPHPTIFSRQNLHRVSRALDQPDVRLLSMDYEEALKTAREGDFVYLDPPYDSTPRARGFTGFTADGFGAREQLRLADVAKDLRSRGCTVVLTNSNTPSAKSLYQGFNTDVIYATQSISPHGAASREKEELLIWG